MTSKTFLVILLNITPLFKLHNFAVSTSGHGKTDESEIFRRHRGGISPYKYLKAHLGSIPFRGIGYPGELDPDEPENVTEPSLEVVNKTEIYDDIPAIPDVNNVKIFEENDQMSEHPLGLVIKPFLQKISGVINYLTHPNVSLTPLYLLSMLKRKFLQHLRDKFGGHTTGAEQEYPYPYRF